MTTICIDTETFYSDECTVKTLGNYNYVRHPDWDCYLVSVAGDNGLRYVGPPEKAPWDLIFNKEHRLLSHNTGFDEAVIERLAEVGIIPKPEYAVWDDTADLVCYLGVPRSLKASAKILLGAEMSKDVRDNMKGKRFSELDDAKQAEVTEYALNDALRTLEIWTKFSDKWPENERWLSRHTRIMGNQGLPIDKGRLNQGIEDLTVQLDAALAAVPWYGATGKVLSRKDMDTECAKFGIEVPKSLAKDDPECIAWEDEYAEKLPFIGAVRTYRRCNMLREKLLAIKTRLKPDGCSLLSLKYFGGHCVTAGHEVLTREGWVPIQDWDGGEIMQWSPGGELRFAKATPNRFVNTEPTIHIDAPYFKGVFTAGHTLPYLTHGSFEHRTMRAGEALAKKSFYIPASGELSSTGTITEEQMRLLVAVQADGHWTHGGILQFCLRKERKMTRLRSLLNRLGIPFREHVFPSCEKQTRFSVSRADCPTWLTRERKVFGPWVLDSTSDARKAFVEELPMWDGHKSRTVREYYSRILSNITWASIVCHLTNAPTGKVHEKKDGSYSFNIKNRTTPMVFQRMVSRKECAGELVYCPTTETGFWMYRYQGAIAITGNTGRWSGDGGVNYQNLPRGDLFGVNLREMVEAPPGKTFVVVDSSQIEARITLWFAKDHATLDLIRNGMDLYEAHARATMGYSDSMVLKDYDKINKTPHRQMAKVRVLGLGFGCGAEKFVNVARIMSGGAVNLTLAQSEEVVQSYRESNRGVVSLWRKLERHLATHANTGQDAIYELPSGRCMTYKDVRRAGGKLSAVSAQKGGLYRKSIWGGVITENLVQATGRDILAHYIKQLAEEGYDIRLHVHDEIVIMCDEDKAQATLDRALEVMSTSPPWIADLPVAAEGSIVNRYTK